MKRIIIIALIPLFYFADANGVDKNTKAIYDSIVKYFVSVSQNREEQDCIKLNIQEYGEDFTRIFNISDFLNNNTPYNDKDLNREFGIYFIQHKYNKNFNELFLITYKGKATLFYRDDEWLIRYLMHLSNSNEGVNISDELWVKLAYYHTYPQGNAGGHNITSELRQIGAVQYYK
ncbi:MAG: hypothetical protein ACI30L_00900 [Muribaculaceae bacterium]